MKRLVLLILLILQAKAYSQNIDERLVIAIESIKERGKVHGVNVDSLLSLTVKNGYYSKLVRVEVVDSIPHEPGVIAATYWNAAYNTKIKWYYESSVSIESHVLNDFNVLETAVAHELGHVLGLKHHERADMVMSLFMYAGKGLYYDLMYKSDHTELRWKIFFDDLKALYQL